MQAIFRFRGNEEVIVSNCGGGGVMLEYVTEEVDPAPQTLGVEPKLIEKRTTYAWSKSQARSIASAIMGAAAEL